jgi:hypothetical protein
MTRLADGTAAAVADVQAATSRAALHVRVGRVVVSLDDPIATVFALAYVVIVHDPSSIAAEI